MSKLSNLDIEVLAVLTETQGTTASVVRDLVDFPSRMYTSRVRQSIRTLDKLTQEGLAEQSYGEAWAVWRRTAAGTKALADREVGA